MKSRFTFEPNDFEGRGQIIVRESAKRLCEDAGFLSTVAYKVGYKTNIDKPQSAMLISLADGMCIEYKDIELLCKTLNHDDFGYRPISKGEMIAIINYQGNRFNI